MPDQATLNHAAHVLSGVGGDQRADTALRQYFEQHSYLSPGARRHVTHAVFAYFRWLGWLDPKSSPQDRVAQASDLHRRFVADAKVVKVEALAVRAVPAWLWDELPIGDDTAKAAYLRQLQREPVLWLRARPGTAVALAKSLFAAELAPPLQLSDPGAGASMSENQDPKPETPNAFAPDAVRFTGTQDLFKTEQFKTGEFEIQDLASQLVGIACAPAPGATWWDACAGEGGKTLHLADLMRNKGLIWASDRNVRRLETLKRRAARAKVFNYRTVPWDGVTKLPTKTKFDGVLVDAPCSGVGTWQRNPHARWTTTLEDVRELAAVQADLLNRVAPALKPGGRLVYAVCTLTRSETTAVAEAFTAVHPEFEPVPLSSLASRHSSLQLWPHQMNANGMFIATWRRRT